MNRTTRLFAAALAAGNSVLQTLQAALITGVVNFSGTLDLNGTSPANATGVAAWNQVSFLNGSGSFAGLGAATAVTFGPTNWSFNTALPFTNFWQAGGFRFELSSSQVIVQTGNPGSSGYVLVEGAGVASGNGYTPTAMTWYLTSQDPQTVPGPGWVFTASFTSENSNGAPVLLSRPLTNGTVISWNDPTFALQAALSLNGPYTNVPGATSPYTNSFNGPQLFFRLDQ